MKARRFAHAIIALAVIVAMSMTATAQKGKAAGGPTAIRVDGKIIKSYIEWLAAPEREGRRTLTPGYEKSVEWAAAKFKEWGVKPAGENGTYLQAVPISGTYAATTGIPELVVDGRAFFVKDSDFALDTASPAGGAADADVVFVGYGISAPEKGLDEYAGLDVKGKIVLAFKGSPADAPPARGMFGVPPPEPKSTEAWTQESTVNAKVMKAYQKGAAAILLFDPTKLPGGGMTMGPSAPASPAALVSMRSTLDPGAFTRPFLAVTDVDVRVFRQVMHRDPTESSRSFSSRMEQLRRDIKGKQARSTATGVKARVKGYATITRYDKKSGNVTSHNVIGKVEGTDPKLKNQYIVIGGHMDHNGVSSSGVIYPGADDDASGTALTMEMARLIAANATTIKPKRTIVFALWCGEEEGLIGSTYYGDHPTDGVTMDNVVLNFNADMVGLGDGIGAPGALNFPTIFDVIMRNQDADVKTAVHPSTAGPGGSDYSAFIERGIEALALMTDGGVGHPDYHDSGDRAEKIDPEILRKTGQFVLQGTINVANDTTTQMVVPDRLHLYNGMRMPLVNFNEMRGATMTMVTDQGITQIRRPGLAPSLDLTAFAGNTSLIEVANKLYGITRMDARTDGVWFTTTVTDRGKEAIKACESAGIVLNVISPSPALLADLLQVAKKPFIVSGLAAMPNAELAKQIKEKNIVVAVDFDVLDPGSLASRLVDYKKLAGDSGNIVVTTREPAQGMRADAASAAELARTQRADTARQQFYLALIKAGWTKDEIYSMVGVTPRPTGQMQMPPPGLNRLGGNLGKLSIGTPTT